MSLEILQVKTINTKSKKQLKLNPILPEPPFLWLIYAPVKSGKSTMIMNLLFNNEFYKNYFEKVIIFSPSIANDKTMHYANQDEDIVKIDSNLRECDSIMEELVNSKMEDEDTADEDWAIILDDMLNMIPSHGYISSFCSRSVTSLSSSTIIILVMLLS
mgnify:CR=1 FL=1